MCKELQCKQDTLNAYLKKMGIEYKGNQGGKGIKSDPKYKTAEEYAQGSSVKSSKLKDKLVRDGIKVNACECCGLTHWQGVELTLELHHKDGNHNNNSLDNLQFFVQIVILFKSLIKNLEVSTIIKILGEVAERQTPYFEVVVFERA